MRPKFCLPLFNCSIKHSWRDLFFTLFFVSFEFLHPPFNRAIIRRARLGKTGWTYNSTRYLSFFPILIFLLVTGLFCLSFCEFYRFLVIFVGFRGFQPKIFMSQTSVSAKAGSSLCAKCPNFGNRTQRWKKGEEGFTGTPGRQRSENENTKILLSTLFFPFCACVLNFFYHCLIAL